MAGASTDASVFLPETALASINLGLHALAGLPALRYDDAPEFFADLLFGLGRLRDSFLPDALEHAPARGHAAALTAPVLGEWRRANSAPLEPGALAVIRAARELCGARRLGEEHPELLAQLKTRWAALPPSAVYGFDPMQGPPEHVLSANGTVMASRWQVFEHGLTLARCAETLGLQRHPRTSVPELLLQLRELRPYRGMTQGGRFHFVPQLHALSSVVGSLRDEIGDGDGEDESVGWGGEVGGVTSGGEGGWSIEERASPAHTHLVQPEMLPHEHRFVANAAYVALELKDAELLAMLLDALKVFGADEETELLRRLRGLLVGLQGADGLWRSSIDADTAAARLHTTLHCLVALRELPHHSRRRTPRLSMPMLRTLALLSNGSHTAADAAAAAAAANGANCGGGGCGWAAGGGRAAAAAAAARGGAPRVSADHTAHHHEGAHPHMRHAAGWAQGHGPPGAMHAVDATGTTRLMPTAEAAELMRRRHGVMQAERAATSDAYLARARAAYAQQTEINRAKLHNMAVPQPPKPPTHGHEGGGGAAMGGGGGGVPHPHAASGQYGRTPWGAVPP